MNKERKILAHLRVSTDQQDVKNQELEILRYCQKDGWKIDQWIQIVASSKKNSAERKVDLLTETLQKGNFTTLLITEVSRLSRTLGEMLVLLEKLETKLGIEVIATKDGDLNKLPEQFKLMRRIFAGYFAQEERRIISQRTKEALATRKEMGIKLGKKEGTIQKSIYDSKLSEIKILLEKKIPIVHISSIIGIGKPLSLRSYLKKRNIN